MNMAFTRRYTTICPSFRHTPNHSNIFKYHGVDYISLPYPIQSHYVSPLSHQHLVIFQQENPARQPLSPGPVAAKYTSKSPLWNLGCLREGWSPKRWLSIVKWYTLDNLVVPAFLRTNVSNMFIIAGYCWSLRIYPRNSWVCLVAFNLCCLSLCSTYFFCCHNLAMWHTFSSYVC